MPSLCLGGYWTLLSGLSVVGHLSFLPVLSLVRHWQLWCIYLSLDIDHFSFIFGVSLAVVCLMYLWLDVDSEIFLVSVFGYCDTGLFITKMGLEREVTYLCLEGLTLLYFNLPSPW